MNILITVLIGAALGFLFLKLKIPGGMMFGTILGVATFNIVTGNAYLWPATKVVAQAFTGAYLGSTMTRDDLKKLPKVVGPYLVVMTGFFILNLSVGLLIYHTTEFDLLTGFLCAMPGGISDTSLIAIDMGADSAAVTVMQFVRMIVGLGCIPSIVALANRTQRGNSAPRKTAQKENAPILSFLPALLLATVAGFLGKRTGIPAGALVFSLIIVSALRIAGKVPSMPFYLRRIAQIISGCCIGATITAEKLRPLPQLAVPAIVICVAYLLLCVFGGRFISKKFGIEPIEAMLFLSPAGVADMVLVAADLGITSTNLAVLQVCRLTAVTVIFPQIFNLLLSFLS